MPTVANAFINTPLVRVLLSVVHSRTGCMVHGACNAAASQSTTCSALLSVLLTIACLLLQDLLTSAGILKSSKHHLTILKGLTGVLKPGRLTLLLGPPGSG